MVLRCFARERSPEISMAVTWAADIKGSGSGGGHDERAAAEEHKQ